MNRISTAFFRLVQCCTHIYKQQPEDICRFCVAEAVIYLSPNLIRENVYRQTCNYGAMMESRKLMFKFG